MRNGIADISKTILHDKMLQYRFLIDITVNNYNLPRSLKKAVPLSDSVRRKESLGLFAKRYMKVYGYNRSGHFEHPSSAACRL